ncbi:hypothetical protein HHL28_00655 [Aerophototrophica crusticola]|uniref:Zinc finger/thioredoxin putative domain-containing protein n=1 Tax=Aerophototrophica crusticola TaxID=1709002 RepID=A0A858R341_9PROT|nr:hypothetical protein HHL28_00655 [Rhodospirillaceae bacterium B3]
MILTCPSCTKRFLLDAALLGTGRRVKCGNCGHVWHQDPPPKQAAQAKPAQARPAAAPKPAPAPALAFADGPADLPPPPEPKPDRMDPPSVSFADLLADGDPDELPPPPRDPEPPMPGMRTFRGKGKTTLPALPGEARKRRGAWLRWGGLGAAVAALVAGVVLARDPILALWPPAFALYEAVGLAELPGTGLSDPTAKAKIEARDVEGTSILFVSGEIANTSGGQRPVPDVMATAYGEDGKKLFSWRIVPAARRLFPNQTTSFESRMPEKGTAAKTIGFAYVAPEGK